MPFCTKHVKVEQGCRKHVTLMAEQECCCAFSHTYASYDFIWAKFHKNYQVQTGERKSPDDLNTIIYEAIHSDDVVIWVAIMIVIIIVNEKDFILNLCKLIIWSWKKLNDLINGAPLSLTQNNCLIAIRFIAECNPDQQMTVKDLSLNCKMKKDKDWLRAKSLLASKQVAIFNYLCVCKWEKRDLFLFCFFWEFLHLSRFILHWKLIILFHIITLCVCLVFK